MNLQSGKYVYNINNIKSLQVRQASVRILLKLGMGPKSRTLMRTGLNVPNAVFFAAVALCVRMISETAGAVE